MKRIKPIYQTTETECAAACMTMICHYHGSYISLEECSSYLTNGRSGTSAKDIVNFSRNQGLQTTAYSIELDQLNSISLPAIAHWGFNHYVVIEKVGKKIEVIDPANGRASLSINKFGRSFTGIVLTFQKEANFKKVPKANSLLKWRKYIAPFLSNKLVLRYIGQFLAVSFGLQLFGLVLPFLTKILVDDILSYQNLHEMLLLTGIGILLMTLIKYTTLYLRAMYSLKLQQNFESILTAGVFSHLMRLPYNFFRSRNSGDLITRVDSNSWLGNLMTSQFILTALDGLLVVGYLIGLALLDYTYFLLAIAIGLIHVFVTLISGRKTRGLMENYLVNDAKLRHFQIEILRGMPFVIATGANNFVFSKWLVFFQERLVASLSKDKFSALVVSFRSALNFFTPLMLIWYGILQVIASKMTLGTMLAANALVLAFMEPFISMVTLLRNLQEGGEHLNRVSTILNSQPEKNGSKAIERKHEMLRIESVSFKYDKEDPYILKNVNAVIEHGEKVSIVGPSGVGKTTLGKLIIGLMPPSSGRIRYGNVDVNNADVHSYRKNIGLVPQDPFIFHGTIKENIAFSSTNVEHESIIQAARKAAIHEDIERMALGYDTIISEGGTSLSGGQIQRIALARALVTDPEILLLDEATSHLDTIVEDEIERTISELNSTRIHIAHRLNTVIDSDKIFFLGHNYTFLCGTHIELLSVSEEYRKLFESQLVNS